MAWELLTEASLLPEWQLTTPVQGEIFRIRHDAIINPQREYLKAVISPCFVDAGVNLLSPKRLSYREENEIFLFYFPNGIAAQQIAFKRLDTTSINWNIQIEVYKSSSSDDDFKNYVIARFGELMPLFSGSGGDAFSPLVASPASLNIGETAQLISALNDNRRGISVFYKSGTFPLRIGVASADVSGKQRVRGILAEIEKGGIYELPVGIDSLYTGTLYAECSKGTAIVEITEFSIPPALAEPEQTSP